MTLKKDINKLLFLFLSSHLILWTVIPSISNENLPLDTIEALAWGSNLDWGYSKHPPLSAFAVEIFYNLFGNQDWAFYFLSQIFIIISFLFIFKLTEEFTNDRFLALISILLLEGIFFYNFTSPEFNVNISQIPFWAASLYFSYRCTKFNKISDYIFLGIVLGFGILSKYLFIYLAIGVKFLFLYLLFKKEKISFKNMVLTALIVLLILSPHIKWLLENDFITISYGFKRTGGIGSLFDHLIYPSLFFLKQIGVLIPFFIMSFFLTEKFKTKIKFNSNKFIFLNCTVLIPIVLMIITSIIIGAKIRTMWMTPFYVGLGVLMVDIFKANINIRKLRNFFKVFLFFFLFSPLLYLTVSILDDTKRTDYPGKEISRLVQNKWDDNFTNEIRIVVGDEWFAGNLSYHLSSRPEWINDLREESKNILNDQGVIYTGNPKILKKVCPGVFGTIKPVGYCMIGRR